MKKFREEKLLSCNKCSKINGSIMRFMNRATKKKKVNRHPSKIDILINQFNSFKGEFNTFKGEFYTFRDEMYSFKKEVNIRFDRLEQRVDKIDQRIDNLVKVNSLRE